MTKRRLSPPPALTIACLVTSILAFWSNPALSENVRVLSGEHVDFSRIVLYFEEREEWTFGRVEGGYELRTGSGDSKFDLTEAFDRMPRTRIQALEDLGNGRLFLAVQCDCHGDVFDLRATQVAIDIKDGPAEAFSARFNEPIPIQDDLSATSDQAQIAELQQTGELATAPPETSAQSQGQQLHFISSEPDTRVGVASERELTDQMEPDTASIESPPVADTQRSPKQARQGLPLFFVPQDGRTEAAGLSPNTAQNAPPLDKANPLPEQDPALRRQAESLERVDDFERSLIRQISRASAQNLLDADLEKTEAQVNLATNPGQVADPASQETASSPLDFEEPTAQSHIHVQTAIDRENPALSMVAGLVDDGLTCPRDEWFDVAAWGDVYADRTEISDAGALMVDGSSPGETPLIEPAELKFGANLGAFRSGLLGEFDRPNSYEITRLVRYYVFLTFGAEAKALVDKYSAVIERPEFVLLLAGIVDGDLEDPHRLAPQFMACDGKVALWAALAQVSLDPGQEINRPAILQAFSELPLHMRRYFGPTLAGMFIDIDDNTTAEGIRSAITRAAGPHGAGLDLLNARIAVSEAAPDTAVQHLENIVQQDSAVTAEALIELVTLKREAGETIEASKIALVASLAFENRKSPLGERLIEAEILGLAANGDLEHAFDRLEHYVDEDDLIVGKQEEIRSGLLNVLINEASDTVFLKQVILVEPENFRGRADRLSAAKRLVSLGFAEPARKLVFSVDTLPNEEEKQLLAEVALLEEKPEIALGYLTGLTTDAAQQMRASALAAKSDHAAASALYAAIDDTNSQVVEAWRAGNWEQVASLDEGVLGAAGGLMIEAGEAARQRDGETSVTLARGQELIGTSTAARGIIENLLNQTNLP